MTKKNRTYDLEETSYNTCARDIAIMLRYACIQLYQDKCARS